MNDRLIQIKVISPRTNLLILDTIDFDCRGIKEHSQSLQKTQIAKDDLDEHNDPTGSIDGVARNSLSLHREQDGAENHPTELKGQKDNGDKEKPRFGALRGLEEEGQDEKGLQERVKGLSEDPHVDEKGTG